jgi:hypothetical protein
MTAADLNAATTDQVAHGDLVSPRESLKTELAAILHVLDRYDKGETQVNLASGQHLASLLGDLQAHLEGLLAVSFPLIEHGSEAGEKAVTWALQRLAREVDRATRTAGWERALLVVVSRWVWVSIAFALSCDRPEFLVKVAAVSVRDQYEVGSEPIIDSSKARFLDAYGGDAGSAFEAHQVWLDDLGLVDQRYPLLARGDERVVALREADMLMAMHAAGKGLDAPYSHGARQGQGEAEAALRSRLRDSDQRSAIREFFDEDDGVLDQRLGELHRALRRPGGWPNHIQLFAE